MNPGPADLAKLSYDLAEGLYVVGTGSTGAAEVDTSQTFLLLLKSFNPFCMNSH